MWIACRIVGWEPTTSTSTARSNDLSVRISVGDIRVVDLGVFHVLRYVL